MAQGATIHLPICHPGALCYFGDVHALQGDGRIVGSGLESTADVTFQFEVINGKRIRWPRIGNDEYIMVAGSVRPLLDALRIAWVELIDWLVTECGFEQDGGLSDCVAGRCSPCRQRRRSELHDDCQVSEEVPAPAPLTGKLFPASDARRREMLHERNSPWLPSARG